VSQFLTDDNPSNKTLAASGTAELLADTDPPVPGSLSADTKDPPPLNMKKSSQESSLETSEESDTSAFETLVEAEEGEETKLGGKEGEPSIKSLTSFLHTSTCSSISGSSSESDTEDRNGAEQHSKASQESAESAVPVVAASVLSAPRSSLLLSDDDDKWLSGKLLLLATLFGFMAGLLAHSLYTRRKLLAAANALKTLATKMRELEALVAGRDAELKRLTQLFHRYLARPVVVKWAR